MERRGRSNAAEECEGSRKTGVPPVSPRTRLRAAWVAILILAFLSIGSVPLQAANEATVKAAYLFNFAKLVDWPA